MRKLLRHLFFIAMLITLMSTAFPRIINTVSHMQAQHHTQHHALITADDIINNTIQQLPAVSPASSVTLLSSHDYERLLIPLMICIVVWAIVRLLHRKRPPHVPHPQEVQFK